MQLFERATTLLQRCSERLPHRLGDKYLHNVESIAGRAAYVERGKTSCSQFSKGKILWQNRKMAGNIRTTIAVLTNIFP